MRKLPIYTLCGLLATPIFGDFAPRSYPAPELPHPPTVQEEMGMAPRASDMKRNVDQIWQVGDCRYSVSQTDGLYSLLVEKNGAKIEIILEGDARLRMKKAFVWEGAKERRAIAHVHEDAVVEMATAGLNAYRLFRRAKRISPHRQEHIQALSAAGEYVASVQEAVYVFLERDGAFDPRDEASRLPSSSHHLRHQPPQ